MLSVPIHTHAHFSGLVAYRELTEAGLDSVPGGTWHYTDEIPLDAPVPNAPTAISDFVPLLPPPNVDLPYSEEFDDDGEIQRSIEPRPIWESLMSNVPLSGHGRFPIVSVTRDNIGDQRHIRTRPSSSLAHL